MERPICTGLALLCLTAAVQADGQSLGDVARKAEAGRKAGSPAAALVFDERDIDPSIAHRELLEFTLDQARWQRFVAADRLVAQALQRDPAALARLQGLQATSIRALERFLQREPALLAAVTAAGASAHEYAYTQLAVGLALALSKRPDSAPLLQTFPEAVKANIAFLQTHERDVKGLAVPAEKLALRVAPLPSPSAPPRAAAGDPVTPPPSPSAAGLVPGPAADPARVKVDDFAFVDFNGSRRRLSDYRGRFVLLDFWGMWCPNCRSEVPYLKEAYAQFQSRGLEIIGMDYEKTATIEEVRRYLVANGITWTFARPDSVRDVINKQFQIDGFPTQILVDPNGDMVDAPSSAFRGGRLARTLDKLLPK